MLLLTVLLYGLADSFNIDTAAPVLKRGPIGSHFGYAVAEHFKGQLPVVLVGAPRANSSQPGTSEAGGVFSCSISSSGCQRELVEYVDPADYLKAPDKVVSRPVHYAGKNRQLLGAVVASSGLVNGRAMVCAPLLRYHNTSAYTDGSCYVLDSELKLKELIRSCGQLVRTDRHNDYGACEEGVSGYVDQSMVITGLPGARKWTGGVFVREYSSDPFELVRDRWTMSADPKTNGVRSLLTSHDYLGFSVRTGRFGFWFEDEHNRTIVSGATRFKQVGAVLFLPFHSKYNTTDSMHDLILTDDRFILKGRQLGSAFGYAVEVLDLNADGFDDLLVGAPFQYSVDDERAWGGAVYVFYSAGKKQGRSSNDKVFKPPVLLKAANAFDQFGLSIARLGNIDRDSNNFQDFAIGAPFADSGAGAVYIFHGAEIDNFRTEPVQVISARNLSRDIAKDKESLKSFGFSLSGGVDLDNNGYPDLVVGAFASDTVAILRSRPIINVRTRFQDERLEIDKDGDSSCSPSAQTCFEVRTELRVDQSSLQRLVDLSSNVLRCSVEVLPSALGVAPRAQHVATSRSVFEWDCGKNADTRPQIQVHKLFIPKTNRDWINALKMRFSTRLAEANSPSAVRDGQPLEDINRYPILHKFGSSVDFFVPFNKKCGLDNVCNSDLSLSAFLIGLPQETDGTFLSQAGEKASIDIQFTVRNLGERAYEALLMVEYDPNELEVPELRKERGSIHLGHYRDNYVTIQLGNPLEQNMTVAFALSFKLTRGKSEGIGKPLRFVAMVNSTSEEANNSDNQWTADVRVIKRAELELIGVSEPDTLLFAGVAVGESEMEFEEDIGGLVKHRYTITNHGPWAVRNVTLLLDWPHQVASVFQKGKWALYMLEMPTISTTTLDGKTEMRRCSTDLPLERINPLGLKLNTIYNLDQSETAWRRNKRSVNRAPRELRIKPKRITEKSGVSVNIVEVGCRELTAKCFEVVCRFDILEANIAAIVDVRARLWNATFVEDYRDVEYVALRSSARLLIDPTQGIEEDASNNAATVSSHAYPDLPAIGDRAPMPWWLIPIAILAGLLILLLIVALCWKIGFFKRRRLPDHPTLYKAQLKQEQESWQT